MSLFIQEYILRFQIPVNNILVMQLFNAKQYLSHIKDAVLLTEEDLISHQSKELSVWQIVEYHMEVELILQSFIYVTAEVCFPHFAKDVFFICYVLDLLLAFDVLLRKSLHGKKLTCLNMPHKVDFAKRSLPQKLNDIKVKDIVLFLALDLSLR